MRSSTRPSVKQDAIVDALRGRIIGGDLGPGARLPTRSELQESFVVSSVTVQRALDQLIDDGFVTARGRHGTFVVAHPPHTCRYGLVMPHRPGDAAWVRFWTALANEAAVMGRSSLRTVSVFNGVDGHVDGEDYQRLQRDVAAQRLAGVIFATPPKGLEESPLMRRADLPRVAVMKPNEIPGLATIQLDRGSFLAKAFDHLAANGRKRIAVLAVPGMGYLRGEIEAGISARGMVTRPYWFQALATSAVAAECARECTHLLMHAGQAERPDGLLIMDDNLVEHATAGLIAAGVRVPLDLEVVAHCNFPWPTPSVIPARRLGFDARQVLRAGIAVIDRLRAGERGVPSVTVDALFEDEIGS